MGTKYVVLIACLAVPVTANAYYLETRGTTTDPLRYPEATEYRLNPSTFPEGVTGIEEAIQAAFETWTDADCASIAFAQGDDSTITANDHWTLPGDGTYILVYFSDSTAEWTSGPSVGHFFFGYDPSGTVLGATIVLNSLNHSWATDGTTTGALDVQSIVTALIGRVLGITSSMEGNATYPVYSPGDTSKRTLGADDLAAIQFLYLEVGCAAPAEPEMICDGVMEPGEDPCPPRVTTMPGDAGTVIMEDAGMTGTDAGMPMNDAGMDVEMDGGCGCRTAGGSSSGIALAAMLGVLAIVIVRRRR